MLSSISQILIITTPHDLDNFRHLTDSPEGMGKLYHRDFVTIAVKELNINIDWRGKEINEKGINTQTNKTIVAVDPKYFKILIKQD